MKKNIYVLVGIAFLVSCLASEVLLRFNCIYKITANVLGFELS